MRDGPRSRVAESHADLRECIAERMEARPRSLLGDPRFAHAVENALKLGEIRRIVAPRCPGGPGMGECVDRVKREARLDCGTRVINSTEVRKGGGHLKIGVRIISIGFERPSIPRYGSVVTAEMELRESRHIHPDVS